MSKNSITRDDWIRAIHEAVPPPVDDPSALTPHEYAEIAGCAWTTARVRLLGMVKAGTARAVTKRIWYGDGRSKCIGAFQLIKPVSRRGRCSIATASRRRSTGTT
jgi:hypothetical protein